tara:strand:+ start:1420 stop:2523 length:1104 start_codon:yes stop_codon:yes gene_type:complete
MNICFVVTQASEMGGAQIHVRDLAFKLKKDSDSPTIVVGEEGMLTKHLKEAGVNYYICNGLQRDINLIKDFRALKNLIKIFKKIKPDLVSLHSSKAGIIGRIACYICKIRCIFTAHGWAFADGVNSLSRPIYIIIEKFFANFCYKIITVSNQDRNLALKYNIAKPNKLIVVHNGMPEIDLKYEKKPQRAKLKLVTVARYTKQKDHKSLLKALSYLPKTYDWELALIGSGKLEEEVKNLAKSLKIDKNLKFLGQISNVSEVLSNSDIFLLISNWEGFPRSILEAMRAALPIITSDVGGSSESMIDKRGGYLVKRNDPITLEKMIRKLMDSKDLRLDQGKFNRKRFLNHFTFNKMYKSMRKIYKDAIIN